MFNLLFRASDSNGIGGVWDNQHGHKPELDGGQLTCGMQRQLQGSAEWSSDRSSNHNLRCRNRPYSFDHLQLYG
jgi:hypothetical protein